MQRLHQLIFLLLICAQSQVCWAADASVKVVRATNERQIQEAVDGHTAADETLQVVLTGSVRLLKGITLRKGTGPVEFTASKAPSRDTEGGAPKPSAALDCSRIKPPAPALSVFSTAPLTISGLTVSGCKGAPAVYAKQAGPVTITDALFKGNNNTGVFLDPPHGGALACIGCEQLNVTSSSFDSNAATIGGAIFAVNLVKQASFQSTWMSGNQGGSEGGSVALANTMADFTNCTFSKSEATLKTGWGGAICAHNCTLNVEEVLFDECFAGESGGGITSGTSNVTITRTRCVGVKSDWFGGCMFFLSRTRATIRDTLFLNGDAATAGGGFHVDRGASAEVFNASFINNTSPYGGAINCQEDGGFVKIRSSRFFNNSASDKGGAIHAETRSHLLDVQDTEFDTNMGTGVGGAVACTTAKCHFSNCTFTNNTVDGGSGGALWSSSAQSLQVNSSTISGNKAQRGGGMCVEAPESMLLYDTSVVDNAADIDGGGVLMVSVLNGTADFVRSPIRNNTAALGGGFMLISANNITLTDSEVTANSATTNADKPIVSTIEGSFSSSGSGGGIYGTQCGVKLASSKVQGNTAAANGGGAALQLCQVELEGATVADNQAASGNGGGISASVAGDRELTATDTTFSNNSAVSGGAVFLSGPTNGVAVGHFHCDTCTLKDNSALSKTASMDLGGGGLMATGNVEVLLTGSTAEGNTATSGPGGALHCLQCNSLSLHDCRLRRNAASGPGGGACCEGCEHVSIRSTESEHNTATAGAGLYLSLSSARAAAGKDEQGISDSSFHNNTASAAGAGADAAPAAQQDDTVGAGGGVFVKNPMPFTVSGSQFTSNHAASGHGGALYHKACTGSDDCTLSIRTSSFSDNKADGGGGAVFTTNGSLLSLPDDRDGFQSSRNKAAFGSDVASNPARLGVASGNELAWLRELDSDSNSGELSTASRRLLARSSSSEPAEGDAGAPRVLYLESNDRFNLEVSQLDHWGSNVVTDASKPADAAIRLMDHGTPSSKEAARAARSAQNSSLCARSCEPGKPCTVGCLTGATTVAFKNGVANFSSVGLSAPANSSLKMQVVPGGLSGVPLVDVLVRVHTCGVGEYQSSSGSCEQCPAPQINLDPYTTSNCSSCPAGANCQAGFPTPLPGYWHSHQRSTLFHSCPNQAACTPADGGRRMLAYQRLHKHDGIPGWLWNETAVGDEYLQAQCAPGRSGPLCSTCARGYGMGPGNVCRKCPSTGRAGAWVAYIVVRLVDVLLVTLLACMLLLIWSRTRSCFAGSGLQDLDSNGSINSSTALRSPSAGGVTDSDDAAAAAAASKAHDSSVADSHLLQTASRLAVHLMTLLDWHQLAYLIFSAAAPLTARGASMLLALLLTTPQSTLGWVPMDCLVGAGRAGHAAAAASIVSSVYPVLLTLATFGVLCVLRPLSKMLGCGQCCSGTNNRRPAAVADAPAPPPVISRTDSLTQASPFLISGGAAAAAAAAAAGMSNGQDLQQQQQQQAKAVDGPEKEPGCKGCLQGVCVGVRQLCSYLGDARKHLGLPGLLVVAALASLCYCSVDLASTAVSAFQCTELDPAGSTDLMPGERRAAQGSWWSKNLNLPCYGRAQVAAAGVAGAVCLPLLVLTVLLVVAVVQAARYKQNTPTGQQLYTAWLSQMWGKRRSGDRGGDLLGHHLSEALAAAGVAFVAPFRAMSPAALWAIFAVVFRIALAVLLTALDNVLGSSVLLRAAVASAAIACMQLLLSSVQPSVSRRNHHTMGGCYMLLQVLCVLTVAAETLQPVGPASRAVLYTLLVAVGSAHCLYLAFRAFRAFCACCD